MLNAGGAPVRGPIATANVAQFMALTRKLIERDPDAPGIGVFHGPSGFGKTYASIFAQNKTKALRVEVRDYWTKKTLLKNILAEAGQVAKGTISDMAEEVIRILGDDPSRPLIVDEADNLVERGLIETVRSIQSTSTAPVILIGEELLPSKIQPFERVHNRVLDWVPAQPSDLDDARSFATQLCPDAEIADDLLSEIVRRSEGRARRIVVNLVRAAEVARRRGVSNLTLASWGDTEFFESRAPSARKFGRGA
ncbi:AAA family ATPase [Aquabacter cavernae]|uniref:AAA family ATPase n=1 Tax=Aquabacter cavernae TaxID=2496029 RepID=UPI000F8CF41C|nr:ATP-binding protein [Aquabacter cavernae]